MTGTDSSAGIESTAGVAGVTYQVVAPLIQIMGEAPFASPHQPPERTLRRGDVVPTWVPAAEVDRLADLGVIEELGK